jgi:hypothetical protein
MKIVMQSNFNALLDETQQLHSHTSNFSLTQTIQFLKKLSAHEINENENLELSKLAVLSVKVSISIFSNHHSYSLLSEIYI